jgi:hypothetical protein
MNWDAAGAIGEVIGAAAVVISVIYLAVQIRRQTHQSRLAATRELAEQHNDVLNLIIEDRELSEIYLKAVQDFDSLPKQERIRVSLLFQRMMRIEEQRRIHIDKGNIDAAFFDSMDRTVFEWLTFPGVQQWWSGSKEYFEPGFRGRSDELFVRAKEQGYHSSYNERGVETPNKSLESDA